MRHMVTPTILSQCLCRCHYIRVDARQGNSDKRSRTPRYHMSSQSWRLVPVRLPGGSVLTTNSAYRTRATYGDWWVETSQSEIDCRNAFLYQRSETEDVLRLDIIMSASILAIDWRYPHWTKCSKVICRVDGLLKMWKDFVALHGQTSSSAQSNIIPIRSVPLV